MRNPNKPKCRNWQASGTCKFGDKCWFLHDDLHNESAEPRAAKDEWAEHCKVYLAHASSPLCLSASGKLIRMGSSNPIVVLKTFDEPDMHSRQQQQRRNPFFPESFFELFGSPQLQPLHHAMIQSGNYRAFDSDSQAKFYFRRLLRVLLQPLFPKCADDIAFGMGADDCLVPDARTIRERFPIVSETSIGIAKLHSLFFKKGSTDFDYNRFQTRIRRHVANVADKAAAADNAWLKANLVACRKNGFGRHNYPQNVRRLDTTKLELEVHRLIALRIITAQCQPQLASRLANTFFLRFEPEYLDRLIQSTLTTDMKFTIALSEFDKRYPKEAEVLKFQMEYSACKIIGKAAATGGSQCADMPQATRKQGLQFINAIDPKNPVEPTPREPNGNDVLSEAMRDAFASGAAVVGALGPLPVWLQGLPCTSALDEDSLIHVTCRVPMKVYMLAVGPRCLETGNKQPKQHSGCGAFVWKSEGTETAGFVGAKHIWPEISEQVCKDPLGFSQQSIGLQQFSLRTSRAAIQNCDVFATMLQPGVTHALDTSDALYFFDTEHHVRQAQLKASGAALCARMQRTGSCNEGDRCNFSHVPPLFFNPEIPFYIGHVLLQCRKQLCAKLCMPNGNSENMIHRMRNHLYTKHLETSWFRARRRVHFPALIAALVLRLLRSASGRDGNSRRVETTAALAIPLRVYRGLRARAADVDDNAFAFVEHGGYVFRTLSNRTHSQNMSWLESGVACHYWEGDEYRSVTRELPLGYEVAPPDAASIDVCTQFEWQSLALMLGDGCAYRTRLHYLYALKRQRKLRKQAAKAAVAAGGAALPSPRSSQAVEAAANESVRVPLQDGRGTLRVNGRVVTVSQRDVLIRRRCWSCL